MDVGSVASMSLHMSQSNAMQDVGMAVLKMAMDADNMQGQQMAAMLESSVNPGVGGNIDYRV